MDGGRGAVAQMPVKGTRSLLQRSMNEGENGCGRNHNFRQPIDFAMESKFVVDNGIP
jgi:hypothetical protein